MFIQTVLVEAEKMAQRLKVLAENLSLIPRNNMAAHNLLQLQFQRMAYVHTWRDNIHSHEINTSKK